MAGAQRDLDQAIRIAGKQLDASVSALSRLQTDAYVFADEAAEILSQAHAQAHYHARWRAGDRVEFGGADTLAGDLAMDDQAEFLARFRDDLVRGRYDTPEGLNERAVRARLRLYLGAVTGTANRVLVGALSAERVWFWLLGAAEQHCGDCPRLAQESPYRAEELPTVPGAGLTECRSACRCSLKSGRRRGFRSTRLRA